jgi:CTP-dependent riboflavin kinase
MVSSEKVTIYGEAIEGLKESSYFTEIPWVKEQFISKLGFIPYPGTFNLEIKEENARKILQEIKERPGIEIVPMENGFCSALCYSVLLADSIEGAMVVPEVSDYPDSKMEIIAPCNIREVLAITNGDLVKVEL